MISCVLSDQDEEEPKDETFSPDGGYIPRILFLGTEGVWGGGGVESHYMQTLLRIPFRENDYSLSFCSEQHFGPDNKSVSSVYIENYMLEWKLTELTAVHVGHRDNV